ncbi:MAG: hypothetical protein G01um101449_321 [Parcubacteria group bacterium Gr01-1014_49]|nr:MAG: hypothetical protein G01um101449_321 [Parcubacteria group bacterium Gr01-1014_49]
MTIIEQHHARVRSVQEQMRSFYARKQQVKIYHGTTNSTRAQKFDREKCIDVSQLNQVVEIHTKEGYALVEPNVPMDLLVAETLRCGLVPPVVPEFPGITVGGAVQGGAEESSSFKWGLFHDTCLEYEIVLGDGTVVSASRDERKDLFFGTACSYGSLGVITLVKLRLIPAKKFVRLTYHAVRSFSEAVELIREKATEEVQFIDGIMFSKSFGVVITGNFSDTEKLPVATFHKSADEWFYLHAHAMAQKDVPREELIPVREYVFRYDRGAFWMGRFGFSILRIPFNRLTRFLMNGICSTRTLYRLFHETHLSQKYFVQDFNLPSRNTAAFLEYADLKTAIYPLWICPLKPGREDRLSANCIETDLVFNIGVWGEADKGFDDFVALNKNLERKVAELGGRKMLYAHAYYARDEFWNIYDSAWYNSLRRTYGAETVFPDVYEKTKVSERYKPSILAGIWNALRFPKLRFS